MLDLGCGPGHYLAEMARYIKARDPNHPVAIANGDVQYLVRVLPDRAPEIELTEPREDTKATTRKKLALAFRAIDDYRLSQAWVVYSVNQGPEQRQPVQTSGEASGHVLHHPNIPGAKETAEVADRIDPCDGGSGSFALV